MSRVLYETRLDHRLKVNSVIHEDGLDAFDSLPVVGIDLILSTT